MPCSKSAVGTINPHTKQQLSAVLKDLEVGALHADELLVRLAV
jgi:hypothetical protein